MKSAAEPYFRTGRTGISARPLPSCADRSTLPLHAQRELDDARLVVLPAQVLQAGRLIRSKIVRVIEEVEEIRREAGFHSLGDMEVLEHCQVLVPLPRSEEK